MSSLVVLSIFGLLILTYLEGLRQGARQVLRRWEEENARQARSTASRIHPKGD